MSKEVKELGLKIDNRFDKLDSFLVEHERKEWSLLEKIEKQINNAESKITTLEKDFAELNWKVKFQDWKIVALFVLFVIILITLWWQA